MHFVLGNGQPVGELLKIFLKAIVFKKCFVVFKVIIHAVEWLFFVALHEQTPTAVAVAKINGAVHGFDVPRL